MLFELKHDRRPERAVAALYRERLLLAILAIENAPARRFDATPSGR
jgi:hypothetical protein